MRHYTETSSLFEPFERPLFGRPEFLVNKSFVLILTAPLGSVWPDRQPFYLAVTEHLLVLPHSSAPTQWGVSKLFGIKFFLTLYTRPCPASCLTS